MVVSKRKKKEKKYTMNETDQIYCAGNERKYSKLPIVLYRTVDFCMNYIFQIEIH